VGISTFVDTSKNILFLLLAKVVFFVYNTCMSTSNRKFRQSKIGQIPTTVETQNTETPTPVKIRKSQYHKFLYWRIKNKILDFSAKAISPFFPSKFETVAFIKEKPAMEAEYKMIFGRRILIDVKPVRN
jgi:hypothetical protein